MIHLITLIHLASLATVLATVIRIIFWPSRP